MSRMSDMVQTIEELRSAAAAISDAADCIIIADGELNIVDYKRGKGVEVSAMDNPQMMLYATGSF